VIRCPYAELFSDSLAAYMGDGKHNIALSRGDGQASVVKRGKRAIAMAKGPKGAAWAVTDGKRTAYDAEGNGRVVVGNGVAYATAGDSNQAIAYSSKAAKKAERRGGNMLEITGRDQRSIAYR
jgi:hypothetical protein